ncbi:MAG: hypothetical protein ACREDT_13750 [Methylocella sp.]
MWQKLKRLLERGEHSKFIWELLGWVGWDKPLKAVFVFVWTFLGGILAMLGHLFGSLPPYMIGAVVLVFFVLAGHGANVCANVWDNLQTKRKHKKAKSPLEIIFDPTNPVKRFWERTSPRDENGRILSGIVWEYRVKVQNTSSKTVKNVRISKESSGLIPVMPIDLVFQKDGKQNRDLQPKVSEFVAVFWKFPPQAGDAWGPTATACHGPITIIASGDDVSPCECEFDYYPDQIPAIVQRGSSQ